VLEADGKPGQAGQSLIDALARGKAAQNIQVLRLRLPRRGMVLSSEHFGSSSFFIPVRSEVDLTKRLGQYGPVYTGVQDRTITRMKGKKISEIGLATPISALSL
jgi:hypothetical protein